MIKDGLHTRKASRKWAPKAYIPILRVLRAISVRGLILVKPPVANQTAVRLGTTVGAVCNVATERSQEAICVLCVIRRKLLQRRPPRSGIRYRLQSGSNTHIVGRPVYGKISRGRTAALQSALEGSRGTIEKAEVWMFGGWDAKLDWKPMRNSQTEYPTQEIPQEAEKIQKGSSC